MESVAWNVPRDNMRIPSSWGNELSLEYRFSPDRLPFEYRPLISRRNYCFEVFLGLIKYTGRRVILTGVEICLTLSKEINSTQRVSNKLSDCWQPIKIYRTLILPLEQGWSYRTTKTNKVDVRHTRHFASLVWLFSQSFTGAVTPRNSSPIIGNAFLPSLVWVKGTQLPRLRIIIESSQSDKAFQIVG